MISDFGVIVIVLTYILAIYIGYKIGCPREYEKNEKIDEFDEKGYYDDDEWKDDH